MKAERLSLCLRHAESVCRKDSLYMDVSGRLICLDQMHPCVCERQTVCESVCVCGWLWLCVFLSTICGTGRSLAPVVGRSPATENLVKCVPLCAQARATQLLPRGHSRWPRET